MDPIALLAVGGGVWWLSRRMAPPSSSVAPPAERQVIVERVEAGRADDPGQMTEDLGAWARRAMGNGGGDYYTASQPPPPSYVAVWRGGSRRASFLMAGPRMVNGVIASAPIGAPADTLMMRAARRAAASGLRIGRSDFGLPGSDLAVRLAPAPATQGDTGRPPGSPLSLIEQLPGQVAGGVPVQALGVSRVRGLVALGALWTVARSSRGFWWVADAASSRAGAPDLVIEYMVSTLGRAAVVLGQPQPGKPNKPTFVGQLAPGAWTPVVVDATGRPSRSVVLPRSDFYPYDGRGPARSPWIGQALLDFLALPVVELPGLQVYDANTGNRALSRRRMYDGRFWGAWSETRAKLTSGANFAQLANGRRAYP